jgi:uncharacterized membrane protein (UPF0127 family)
MKSKLVVLLLVTVLFGLGWIWGSSRSLDGYFSNPAIDGTKEVINLTGSRLEVEVVNTPESLRRGLGGRTRLETDGMLFVYPSPQPVVFWMKDMLFAIDIIWLRDGEVIGIERNAQPPEPETPDNELELYQSPGLVDMVLETEPGKLAL